MARRSFLLLGICFFTAGTELNHTEALPQEQCHPDAVKYGFSRSRVIGPGVLDPW